MRVFFDDTILPSVKEHILPEEESKHIVKVLRLKTGDQIKIVDGKGNIYKSTIKSPHQKKCEIVVDSIESRTEKKYSIHIAIAPTKQMDRLEWFVEKATEIGITEISLVHCNNNERTKVKLERLQKRAVSALKQSRRYYLPIINEMVSFNEFVKKHNGGLIAHCYDRDLSTIETSFKENECPILIGPEGDFTNEEINLALEYGYKTITLGENRLRTETAALVSCMKAVQIVND